MKKAVLVLAVALFAIAMLAVPVFAAKPTVVDEDVWFVASRKVAQNYGTYTPTGGIVPDRVWSTEDGKILHNMGTVINWDLARSPPGQPGTVPIGSMTTESNFVFNTETGKGTINMKVTISLTQTDPTKNPYGVGTLEGTLIADVTTVNPRLNASFGQIPGTAEGFVVTTHGTGAFEDAKLTADLDMRSSPFTLPVPPAPVPGLIWYFEYIFFGTHINYPENEGVLTYHNPGK